MSDKEIQIIIAIKRSIRKFRNSDSISIVAKRELERVLRNIRERERVKKRIKKI